MVRPAPADEPPGIRSRRSLGVGLAGGLLAACGGAAEAPLQRTERGEQVVPAGSFAADSPAPPRAARSNLPEVPEPSESPFDEQGCDEPVERIVEMGCDPFQPDEGCGVGKACQPFVDYPESPCEPERFGARCEWVGDGVQGDPCNLDLCASGYLCIATGQGTQCAQICRLSTPSGCPPGLVCGALDIEGIGTCF